MQLPETLINVGIVVDSEIEFELKNDFLLGEQIIKSGIYNAIIEGEKVCTSFACKTLIELKPRQQDSTFILKNVKIGIGFHWEKTENQEFEGGLTFQVEDGSVRAINNIYLESYLKSVISSEMSAMNDPVLLQVHTIVSRSWLLAQIDTEKSKSKTTVNSIFHSENEIEKWYDREDHSTFDVCADDHCQRYQGITKIISDNAAKAVELTQGQVITFENKVCDARFSKCCGGISENFENVWQAVKVPYLSAVIDFETPETIKSLSREQLIDSSPKAFCNTNDSEVLKQVLVDFDRATTNFYRWSVSYSQDEISLLVAQKSGIDFGAIIDLVPLERGASGRIFRLKIIGSKQTVIVGKELEIRKWLSKSHLFSSAFLVEKQNENGSEIPLGFVLRGAGWGHGVGMCQIGAAVMSQKGYSVYQILEHYFKGAKLETIY